MVDHLAGVSPIYSQSLASQSQPTMVMATRAVLITVLSFEMPPGHTSHFLRARTRRDCGTSATERRTAGLLGGRQGPLEEIRDQLHHLVRALDLRDVADAIENGQFGVWKQRGDLLALREGCG